jgi:GTPase SAR1 family protein
MRYCQLVIGPAGSGKSTYCSNLARHCEDIRRPLRLMNLDPAAEYFDYKPDVDVRELISLDDVLDDEEVTFGPNGGLVFCMEFIAENLEWLDTELGDDDDDYWAIDCPGQIELYTHLEVMRTLVEHLQHCHFRVCAVFLVDVQAVTDVGKFIGSTLASLSAMVTLEVPHVNVFTKLDMLQTQEEKDNLNSYLDVDALHLINELKTGTVPSAFASKFASLNHALIQVLDNYSMVQYYGLDISEEDSIRDLTIMIDNAIQFGEDSDVRDTYNEGENENTDD